MRTSINYIATVPNAYQSVGFVDTIKSVGFIEAIKQGARQRPREVYVPGHGMKKCRWVVRVRGQLGKNSEFKHLYAVGGPLHRRTAQDIRIEHADRLDIYVQQIIVW